MASPSLNPTGFLEFEEDTCQMLRERSQPSRESIGITQLNEVVEKYGNTQYKGGDFLELASMIKWFSRSWNKLPEFAKKDFLTLILESNNTLSVDLLKTYNEKNNKLEKFGDLETPKDEEDAIIKINKLIATMNPEFNIHVAKVDNRMNIFVIIVISIVAIIIGFLIAVVGR